MKTLCLILGDQLSESISSLKDHDIKHDTILMCEVWDEATYVKHHKKKIAFLFSAMRHFAAQLKENGFHVQYTLLDDKENAGSFRGEIERELKREKYEKIVITFPGEYRVLKDIETWENDLGIPVEIRGDDRFLSSPGDFSAWASGRKQLRMEFFYREMRKRHNILMDGNDPVGGQWNYDPENREPPKEDQNVPKPFSVSPDEVTLACIKLVRERFGDHFGDLEHFHYAVTRADALSALQHFIDERLPKFGTYQDAMLQGEPWMYHSHISFYLNCGLLLPHEVIIKAEEAYYNKKAPLNAVEGFIRQILGWREYIRGLYWHKMPEYQSENYLNAERQLPWLYWSGDTKMNCMRQCVQETKAHAYAHHIQRLMVLGNFALLAGLHPDQVNEWYLVVYADAYEWVELPNVTGMILYADGGLIASKPYAASGAYINRMSDYCKNCSYKVTKKNGADACPFNYLYWNFFARHEDKLKGNIRLSHVYRTLNNMTDEKKEA
ncbi:MAG: cryptochrome/photolyase family protein, partial [Micavibrio aeruginosavorus]